MNILSRIVTASLILGLILALSITVVLFGMVWYAVVFSLGLGFLVSWVGYSLPVAILLMGVCECAFWIIRRCYG